MSWLKSCFCSFNLELSSFSEPQLTHLHKDKGIININLNELL